MKQNLTRVLVIIIVSFVLCSQVYMPNKPNKDNKDEFDISGVVIDLVDGLPLWDVDIFMKGLKQGRCYKTYSNFEGLFVIKDIYPDYYDVEVNYFGITLTGVTIELNDFSEYVVLNILNSSLVLQGKIDMDTIKHRMNVRIFIPK